jgi:hypothetical protein
MVLIIKITEFPPKVRFLGKNYLDSKNNDNNNKFTVNGWYPARALSVIPVSFLSNP